ncbi:ribosomal protein S2 [Delitschia confertaspora ATCC 74209]|uniref:Ribosomal protein S2 n=1 Tax=Delitschia confertaspora ATCC 74209 TaxID=1513339 RepID=A0A9P4JK49_9PLEO|nr:ribosomal protein S2 [Delitschia confertaspora ATCC 74209]
MIIRSVVWRQGRRAVAQKFWQPLRTFSSAVDSIDSSAQNSLKQLHSLEAQINAAAPTATPVASIDPETATTAQSAVSESLADQYHRFKARESELGDLGTEISPHYQPNTLLNNPPSPADVTLELLLASEAHQGHATSLWNPANARYIHGIRQGIHIISLETTAAHLRRAAKVVQEVSRRGGIVLFVGTRPGQERAVVKAAELSKGYHLFERWIPGSITNGQQILGRCKTKVVNEKDEEVQGFEEQLFDRAALRPDLVVCLNPLENYVLLHECALNNIPTIGVIDTNADPTWVTYPIPANDDSLRCIQVIAGVLGRAGEQGSKQRLAAAEKGVITFPPARNLRLPEEPEAEAEAPKRESEALGRLLDGAEAISSHIKPELFSTSKSDHSLHNADDLGDMLDETNNHETNRRIKQVV